MTKPLIPEGVLACALDRYLAGEAEAPRRGQFPFAPLALLCLARYGRRAPSLRGSGPVGEDLRVVGLYRSLQLALDEYNRAVERDVDRPEAEHLLKVRAMAAYDYCLTCIADTDYLDLEVAYEVAAVHEQFRLLAGVLALCLWHVGDVTAREDVRARLPNLLGGADGHRYVRASLGMQEDVGELYWRAGSGSLGSLPHALKRAQRLLDDVGQGAPAHEPEWATEAKAKAAREKAASEALESGPSLLVLASVDHLPGLAKSGEARTGGTTGSTPRNEWAPLAGRRLPLAQVPDLAAARAILVAEFPDDTAIVDAILLPLAGRAYVALPPMLLVGPPGTGKSRFARRIGEVLGLVVTVYGCAGVSDSSFIGTSRQWSSGRACVPLQAIKRAGAASVLVVLDEISRAGTRADNGRLVDGVLALTERETARAYTDPYLECAVDLSGVSYLATANSLVGLDAALLSRFRVLEMGPRTAASLPSLTRGILVDLRAERGLDESWLPGLDPEEETVLAEHWRDGSVRTLRALVEGILAARDVLATRM